ncbi:ABC transporter [Klebsiella michiganensis]|nr:ABC transporter [Klebsiella michiganensis]
MVSTISNKAGNAVREGANKQVISSQADSLIKISRIWADFFPANTSNQPI